MELNDIIPLKFIPTIGCEWVVKNKFLMYKHYDHIPVAFIENDIVYVFLDNKISRQILKLTKWLIKGGIEFYFTSPLLSNPKGIFEEDIHSTVIKHYLYSYIQKPFFEGFKKIEFDIIDNMVKWCIKEKCIELIKDCYDQILIKVNRSEYDYWSNKSSFEYKGEIREDYKTLYRDIQINIIL
jgi:hypothetical protein